MVELFSSVYHTVSYGAKLFQRFQCTEFWVGQDVEDELYAFGMFGDVFLDDFLHPVRQSHFQERTGQTYFFYTALCHDGMVGHVV